MKPISFEIKKALAAKAKEVLEDNIQSIRTQMDELSSAGNEETKSSAGDKYETQREMIKQNQDVLDGQLTRAKALLYQLNAISNKKQDSVEEGALFRISLGNIWVSVSFGKIELDREEYQLISKDSPIFLALKNKKKGETIEFRRKKIVLEDVV